jgi:hypothetical protein
VALIRIDVSEKRITSIISVKNERARNNVSSNYQPKHAANVVLSSLILFTVMVKAIRSSEMSVLTRATRCHIQEDSIIHSQSRENLESCMIFGQSDYLLHHSIPINAYSGHLIPVG